VAAAGGGDTFNNDGNVVLYVRVNPFIATTITFATPGTPKGLVITPLAHVVANSAIRIIGPFPPEWFNDANGRVTVTYSQVTNLLVEPIRIRS